jgi:hypothetical protein
MSTATFDSLQFVRILRDKGKFTTEQAESIADAMAATLHDDLATKGDMLTLKSDLKAEIAEMKTEIIKWMFGTIGLQTIIIIGAVIALVRQGHP